MPKWKVYRPTSIEPIAVTGVRLDGSVDRSLDTYATRVASNRREMFPVIDAEQEAEKARRDNRSPRYVRCPGCGRTVVVGKPCWHCATLFDRRAPIDLPPLRETHATKARDDAKRAARKRAARNR